MNIDIIASKLPEALAWVRERGYYESDEKYHYDRVRVDIHREQYGDDAIVAVTFHEHHIVFTPEDLILFKLTFGGK